MLEVEDLLYGEPKENYNDFLQVLIPIDSNETEAQKANFDYIIEKASLPIQWHKTSKWVDDCYLLIGKARLYQTDHRNAITTFKYVNARSKDDNARHQALIWLLRTFIETREYNNFKLVLETIGQERTPFNDSNIRDYHLVMAYHYRQLYAIPLLTQHLALALPYVKNRKQKARLSFLMGQLYRELGDDSLAYQNYLVAKRLAPNYNLEFQSNVAKSVVARPTSAKALKKTTNYFNGLLKDENNWELRDKIYYEMAKFEFKQANTQKALAYLDESVQVSTNNPVQKGYAYLLQGDIYYASIKDFEKAAECYKNAVKTLPKDVRNYDLIAKRAEILQRLAKEIARVRAQDRLLALSQMNPAEAQAFLEEEIAQEKEGIITQKEREKASELKKVRIKVTRPLPGFQQATGWYFYNAQAISRGEGSFLKKWGNRPLEDNWRRKSKPISFDNNSAQTATQQPSNTQTITGQNAKKRDDAPVREDPFAAIKPIEDRLAAIPQGSSEIQTVRQTLVQALYMLGKIYRYELFEFENAIAVFERLLREFPESNYGAEVAYILYATCKEKYTCDADKYRKILSDRYPETFYARVINSPEELVKESEIDDLVEKMYSQAFQYYKQRDYKQADDLLEEIALLYAKNSYIDKVKMLQVLILGKTATVMSVYYAAINRFIQEYPDSDLVPMAKKLLAQISDEDLEQTYIPGRL